MAIGPVQLLVLGFNHPDFHGEIIAELERLRETDLVRVIDPERLRRRASPAGASLGGPAARRDRGAGGFRISDGFISPLDLVEIGLLSADEAQQLHAMETARG